MLKSQQSPHSFLRDEIYYIDSTADARRLLKPSALPPPSYPTFKHQYHDH